MNVALAALNATIHVQGLKGKRSIPFADFHRLPGTTPQLDTTLKPDELILAVELAPAKFVKNCHYLKARDRNSYAFALVSVAAGLEMSGDTVRSAGLALGGVAHKPLALHGSREGARGCSTRPRRVQESRRTGCRRSQRL